MVPESFRGQHGKEPDNICPLTHQPPTLEASQQVRNMPNETRPEDDDDDDDGDDDIVMMIMMMVIFFFF